MWWGSTAFGHGCGVLVVDRVRAGPRILHPCLDFHPATRCVDALRSDAERGESAMAARYQHLTGPVRDDIASRVGGLLWGPTETKHPTPSGTTEPGTTQ
jgi:hypothetical protein